jgi:GntR family transcriptional regulator
LVKRCGFGTLLTSIESVERRSPVSGAAMQNPREPKYYAVKRHLLERIESLEPGSAVSTERDLSAALGISRTTVRQASLDLVAEGRLIRRQGKGTYVAEPKMTWPLLLTSFTARAEAFGFVSSTELLNAQRARAGEKVAASLGIDNGAMIYRIERLRLADGRPMAVETSHLSAKRFPGLTRYVRRETSLYAVLERVFGTVPASAQESISTAPAPPREAALLGTDTGNPMLSVVRHTFDDSGAPFEWVTSWYRGDRVTLVASLTSRLP